MYVKFSPNILCSLYVYCIIPVNLSLVNRYTELNIRSSSLYRKYSTDVYPFLRDRPREIIEHVMPRYAEGKEIKKECVSMVADGVFRVQSASDNRTLYTVLFNNDGMPSCECFDWRRHHLPCKHFCAIFHHYEDYDWGSLPTDYKNSPFFALDEVVIGESTKNEKHGDTEHPTDASNEAGTCTEFDERSAAAHKAASCRELLTLINDSTYLTEDLEALNQLHSCLNDAYSALLQSTPSCGGILLNREKVRGKRRRAADAASGQGMKKARHSTRTNKKNATSSSSFNEREHDNSRKNKSLPEKKGYEMLCTDHLLK